MDFLEMKEFVRTHADTDETDAPDSSLESYAREAYRDIQRRDTQWEHLESTYSLSVTASDNTYPISGIGDGTLQYIKAIIDPNERGKRVPFISKSDADLYYGGDTGEAASADFFTVWADTIELFPYPSTSRTYTVRGYRSFTAWPNGDGSEADLPRDFDEPICWYMLGKFYMAQEEPQLASMYFGQYDDLVQALVRRPRNAAVLANRPLKMGGRIIGRHDDRTLTMRTLGFS